MQKYHSPKLPAMPLAEAVPITGRYLRDMLRGAPPHVRAMIGAQFVAGKWRLIWPTPAEAARACGTHARLIHRALGHPPRAPSDAKVDRIIARLGPDRVMQALDRLTRPAMAAE